MHFSGRVDVSKFADKEPLKVSGVCKKFLVNIDGQTYVFKQNYKTKKDGVLTDYFKNQFMPENVDELHGDIVEVFSSYFLMKIGCDFALPYFFASLNGENGCLSPNFKGNGEKEIVLLKILMNIRFEEIVPKEDFSSEQIDDFFKDFDALGNNREYCLSVDYIVQNVDTFANLKMIMNFV